MKKLSLLTCIAPLFLLSVWADKKPNIIFMLADDHQAMAMGCMGNRQIETPNLDKLAAKGVLFERAYATSPICMPSRATVMSGQYEYRTGCSFMTGKLSEDRWLKSYPMILRKGGYRTAFAGKWGFHIGSSDSWARDASDDFDKWGALKGGQGFYDTDKNPHMAAYAKEYPHVTRALGAFGRDFIQESVEAGEPFCLSLSFKAPHLPHHQIDKADRSLYAGVTFDLPPAFGEEGAAKLPMQAKLGRQYEMSYKWDVDHYQDALRRYYQLISGVDSAVGMVVEALEKAGVADNTVIIYTADNGYSCGAHGLQGKSLPYEQPARIPLIIADLRLPSNVKGLRSPGLVANIDFLPTILELAGMEIPDQVDGQSLVPTLSQPEHRVREVLGILQKWDLANRDVTRALAVITEDYKYINWCYADENIPPAEELFDLRRNPNEENNVAANPEKKEALEAMQANYDAFHQEWSENCIDNEDYTRYRTIFDRNIAWQDKEYRVMPLGEKDQRHKRVAVVYEDVTGKPYPKQK